jgi:hypothetical protein
VGVAGDCGALAITREPSDPIRFDVGEVANARGSNTYALQENLFAALASPRDLPFVVRPRSPMLDERDVCRITFSGVGHDPKTAIERSCAGHESTHRRPQLFD